MTEETFADRLARQSIEAMEAQKGVTIRQVDVAGSIVIRASDGRDLLAIHQDGTVTGSAEDASEAAVRFFEHLREHVAGFRRTEESEPTEQGKKRLREAADRMSPLSKVPYTSLDLALVRDAAYRASELPEPQGEPSDAQVEALVDAAMSVAPEPFKTWRYRMTAALRASGGVR